MFYFELIKLRHPNEVFFFKEDFGFLSIGFFEMVVSVTVGTLIDLSSSFCSDSLDAIFYFLSYGNGFHYLKTWASADLYNVKGHIFVVIF